jgi:hypothetical protein
VNGPPDLASPRSITTDDEGVGGDGSLQFRYIDNPKWLPAREYLWVGHYIPGFARADLFRLTPSQANGVPPRLSGVLLLNYRAAATITDCESGITLADRSDDLYLVNHFALDVDYGGPCVSRTGTDQCSYFSDGQWHLDMQIANHCVGRLFRNSPGYRDSSGTAWRTAGTFRADLVMKVIGADDYPARDDPALIRTPGFDHSGGTINGHKMGGTYWGYTSGQVPAAWEVQTTVGGTISVRFEWDDCGAAKWRYSCRPPGRAGADRISESGAPHYSGPRGIDLLRNPDSRNW